MLPKDIIQTSNRHTGKWLPQVTLCPEQLKPCGNPWCCDESMRAGEIISGHPDQFLAKIQSRHALDHAHQIASTCVLSEADCPLCRLTGQDKGSSLQQLFEIHSK